MSGNGPWMWPNPDNAWQQYRRAYLTANGWRYDAPGVYVHQESGAEFHPYRPVNIDGHMVEQWKILAENGEAPDPQKTHIERRQS